MAYKVLGKNNKYYYFADNGKRIKRKKYYAIKKANRTRQKQTVKQTVKKPVKQIKDVPELLHGIPKSTKAFVKIHYTKMYKKKMTHWKETEKINNNYYIDRGISRRNTSYEVHKMLIAVNELDIVLREYGLDATKGYSVSAKVQFITGRFSVKNELKGKDTIVSKPLIMRNIYRGVKRGKEIKLTKKKEIENQMEKELATMYKDADNFINGYLKDNEISEPELINF